MRYLLMALIFLSTPAFAGFYTVLDNGEVLGEGKYKMTGDLQLLTDDGGLNVGGTFDMGFNDEFGVRALLGFGEIDFFGGAFVKWMPVPDIDNQPAMGMNVGLLYGNEGDYSDLVFRVEPMLSKRIKIEDTVITPYAAVPVGIRMREADRRGIDDDTKATFQLVVGSQLQIPDLEHIQFMGEIGLDLDNAPGYISFAGVFYFPN